MLLASVCVPRYWPVKTACLSAPRIKASMCFATSLGYLCAHPRPRTPRDANAAGLRIRLHLTARRWHKLLALPGSRSRQTSDSPRSNMGMHGEQRRTDDDPRHVTIPGFASPAIAQHNHQRCPCQRISKAMSCCAGRLGQISVFHFDASSMRPCHHTTATT